MTPHEQVCFNEALHKLKVRDAELRVRAKLETKLRALDRMKSAEQMPYLFKLEEAIV